MTDENRSRYRVNAVIVSLRILEYLAENPRSTLSRIAAELELNSSLCYRMLVTLGDEGMVTRDANRLYSLGYKTVYLGYQAQRGLPLAQVAAETMARLVENSGETVHLAVLDGIERVIVAMQESPQMIRVSTPVGTRFPLYFGGTGLCMFAWLDRKLQERIVAGDLVPRTEATELDPQRILDLADTIRLQGFHAAVGDFAEGAFSVAAPIFTADGDITAAIAVTGPTARLDDAGKRRFAELVVAAGREISANLGYLPSK